MTNLNETQREGVVPTVNLVKNLISEKVKKYECVGKEYEFFTEVLTTTLNTLENEVVENIISNMDLDKIELLLNRVKTRKENEKAPHETITLRRKQINSKSFSKCWIGIINENKKVTGDFLKWVKTENNDTEVVFEIPLLENKNYCFCESPNGQEIRSYYKVINNQLEKI